MIPIRPLMETLEKDVNWDPVSKEISISDETVTVKLKEGSDIMTVETFNPVDSSTAVQYVTLQKAPMIVNERTLLPVRAVAEAFGMAVIWEAEQQVILIVAGVC